MTTESARGTRRPAPVVAIDGPAGAGKSTVSQRVADALGYTLLDTGALYRCVGFRARELGVTGDPEAVARVATALADGRAIRFETTSSGERRVWLLDADVTEAIRTPEASNLASLVSAIPAVRQALLQIQRDFGREGRVVVEGRDIGTVVFPDAEAKFFLTASVEERAARRFAELQARTQAPSQTTTLDSVQEEVRERDRRDSQRPVAPLVQAPDAELVDSTSLDIDGVVQKIVQRVREIAETLT